MKAKDLAARLHGVDLNDIPSELDSEARRAGLVVVYGISRDTVEFCGALRGEADVPQGGIVYFDADGLLPEADEVPEAERHAYYDRKRMAGSIYAEWQQDGFAWTFTMAPPHSRFVMSNDGQRYCRGIVFSLASAGVAP